MAYHFHHLHMICSNLEEMIKFFSGDLGAKLVERRKFGTADGASLDLNGYTINLRVAREGEEILDDESRPHYGYNHIAFQVEDLDATYGELTGKGIAFTGPPKDLGAVKVAFLKGPDNIEIELVQPLS